MRKLVFSSFNFAPAFTGPSFNILQTLIDEGHEVYYITCLKSFKSCGFNTHGYKYMCDLCEYRFNKTSRQINGLYTTVKMQELLSEEDLAIAKEFIQSAGTINKNTFFENFDVGESVLSSYISKTRDMDMELNISKDILPQIAEQAITVYLSVKRFLINNKIEEIFLFNGRWDYYRAVFRAAHALNIPCNVYENFRPGGYIELYGNNFPHLIRNFQNKVDSTWNKEHNDEFKKKEAGDFFVRKRNGEVIRDRSYTTAQLKAFLPGELVTDKKIISLFTSSDDETAAVGGDEYANPYFKDQLEGIEYVAEVVAHMPDYILAIRVHPNLSGLNYGYLSRLTALKNKFPGIILINPESKVDSYALMDISEKIISFGSSIGVEAVYWNKPLILLSKSFYFYSEIAYQPRHKEDIPGLLKNYLEPKSKEGAEKIAFYFMSGGVKAAYYDFDLKTKKYYFKNKRLDTIPFIPKNYFRLLKWLKIKNR